MGLGKDLMKQFLVLLPALLAMAAQAAPPVRLHRAIDPNQTFVLEGHTRSLLRQAQDLGTAESSLALPRVELHFNRTAAQSADLEKLLEMQRDRSSSLYHKWLTPEEFGARYGLNETDLAKVRGWLETEGFTNVEISRSRTFVRMSGTATQANQAFGAEIHQYRQNGKTFYANAANPVLPKALAGMVNGLTGLTNLHVRPFVRRKPVGNITVGINGNHFLGPDDLATIYDLHTLYNQGTNGSGQTIAIVGQSDIKLSDIAAFQTAVGLPLQAPQVVLAGVDPGIDPDSATEADLDLEWSGAVARGANIIYVNSTDALESAVYAIDNGIAPVVSISYGLCEAALSPAEMNAFSASFEQGNAQGITTVVSSGDSGAAACDFDSGGPEPMAVFGLAVNFPASSPYVTAVGGTEFDEAQGSFWDNNGHALSYIPEVAWNDTAVFSVLAGSGGGVSAQFTKPDWQSGTGVPADGQRDLPDIAFSSSPIHDPYLICSGGSCSNGFAPPVNQIYFVGGTSCAAPVFAGILALLNQTSYGGQGNVNPVLYTLASFNSGVFHDVELGDNREPCLAGTNGCQKGYLGYTTGPGYDQVTGLGSIDATQLVEQWGSDFQIASPPTTIAVAAGGVAVTNLQVKRFVNFAGAVTFTCAVSSSLTNTTCSISNSVSGGSGTAALTLNNTSSANLIPRWKSLPPVGPLPFLAIGTALFGLLILTQQRKWLPVGFAALCLLTATSCGNGSSVGSQPVSHSLTGTVTVTGTSGILQHTITIPVTVS